ncbi:alpha/beta hydrolase-fold protein [Actinoplanes sp. NPDC051851]|uniref:alpha/beta hydrolase n=1 Tax=Actinoplanes sp. NPDC051851 TaxID=3154753 RepID=UPI00342F025B
MAQKQHVVSTTPEQMAEIEQQWIDPVRDDQELTTFELYPQPSRRTPGAQGSLQLYLPPQYATEPDRRFPVVYWLHGGFGDSRQGHQMVERIHAAITAERMPPAIVVLPHILPIGWYVDSKDGARPLAQITAFDLVGHIDATYRTIPTAAARTVEGFSMGGFGALHLGLKYPKIFGRVSAVGPAILRDLKDEPEDRIANTFFGDQAYYDALGPWGLVLANAPELRVSSRVRLLSGSLDTRLAPTIRDLDRVFTELGVDHDFHEVPGADHEYPDIMDGYGDAYYAWWR